MRPPDEQEPDTRPTRPDERARDREVCKPVQAESEIAYAKGRVKPLARLLRCATALRVTAPLDCATALRVTPPLGLRLKASGMAERFPFGPSTRPEIHPAVSFWAHRHLWLSNAIK